MPPERDPVNLRERVRSHPGPLWDLARRVHRGARSAHIPVAGPLRPLVSAGYHLHVGVRRSLIRVATLLWSEPLLRSQCQHVGERLRLERLPYMEHPGRIWIGDDVTMSGRLTVLFGRRRSDGLLPELRIGDATFIGHDTQLAVAEQVVIGRHCYIAGGVIVRDNDGHPMDAELRRQGEPVPPEQVGAVVIGDDVWIGARAMVLKGVTIGDRAVVATGAVVTTDVAAATVVAGNPARVVKQL